MEGNPSTSPSNAHQDAVVKDSSNLPEEQDPNLSVPEAGANESSAGRNEAEPDSERSKAEEEGKQSVGSDGPHHPVNVSSWRSSRDFPAQPLRLHCSACTAGSDEPYHPVKVSSCRAIRDSLAQPLRVYCSACTYVVRPQLDRHTSCATTGSCPSQGSQIAQHTKACKNREADGDDLRAVISKGEEPEIEDMEKESDNLPSSGTDARGSRRPSPASVPKPYYYRCLPNRAADAAEKTKMQKQSQKTELMRDHPLQRNVQSEKDHDRIEDIAQQSITEGDSNSYGWFVRPDTPDLRESHMVKGGAGWYVRPPSSDLTGSRRMRRRMQDIPIEKLQAVKPVNGHENVLVTYTQIQACENLDQNQNSGALASVSDLRSRHKKFEGPVEPAFYRLNHPSRRLLGGFLRPASACSAREYERGGLFMLGGRRRLCRVEPLWHASCRKIRSRAPSSGCSRPVSECTERECRRRHQTNVHQRRLLNSSADKSYKENASDHSYQLQVPASKLKPSPYRYKDMSTILSSEPRKQRSALAKKTENTRQAMRDSLSTPADLRRARNPKKAQNDQKSEDDHGNLKHIQYRMPEKTYTDNVSTVDHSDIASLSGRSDSTAALNGFYEREPLRPPSANENIKTKRHDMDYEEGRTPCSSRAGSTGGRPRYKPGSKGTTPDYDSCYSQDEDDKRDELQSMAESELEESSRTPSRSRASNPDSKIKDKRGCLSEASTPRTTDERSSSTRREQHTSKRADKEKKSNGVPPNDSRGAVCPFQDTSHGAVTCSSSVISLPAIKPRQNEAQNQQLKLSVEVFPSPSAPKGFGLKITQHFPKEHQHAQVEYVNGLGLSPRSFQTSVCRRCSS